MKKEIKMKFKGEALVAICCVVGVIAVIGFCAHIITKKDDGIIEEASETIVEETVETVLELPSGSLHGKVDFTPASKEK